MVTLPGTAGPDQAGGPPSLTFAHSPASLGPEESGSDWASKPPASPGPVAPPRRPASSAGVSFSGKASAGDDQSDASRLTSAPESADPSDAAAHPSKTSEMPTKRQIARTAIATALTAMPRGPRREVGASVFEGPVGAIRPFVGVAS